MNEFFVTKSAAAGILEIKAQRINELKIGKSKVMVHTPQGKLTIPFSRFTEHFVKVRQEKAKEIRIQIKKCNHNEINAIAHHKERRYQLRANWEGVECNCTDYHHQKDALGSGLCKHGYAFLNAIGCKTLPDYLALVKDLDGLNQILKVLAF